MSAAAFATTDNLAVIESAYEQWRRDSKSVDATWQAFFAGFELGGRGQPPGECDHRQTGIVRLVYAYRDLGHFQARLDPLGDEPPGHPLLDLHHFGLSDADLDATFDASAFLGLGQATLRELLAALRDTYCRSIGVEFMHIQDTNVRHWLMDRMEPRRNRPDAALRQKLRILMELHYAELFEKFLHTRFVGQKRFSLEGAETLLPLLDALVEKGPDLGVQEMVIGMAHRGRLNVLANLMGKPYQDVFAEFEDLVPETVAGDGDVKYHLGYSSDRTTAKGQSVHLSLAANPSHLEVIGPVVEGRVRAKQFQHNDEERIRGVPVLIHGDAAFAGQGLVAETLNLYNLPGFKGPLRLPREVYVDILRGAIKSWDDPRIKAANPELTFPRRDIALVARLDRSGTTFALTGHLSAISETWRKGPGAGTAIEWPRHAMLARGNEGVASRVKISEGSLGYVEFGFASRLGLAMAELENKSGKFVKPGLASGQSALAESVSALGNPMRTDITDPAQPDSYPITTFTWLLLYRSYPDENRRNAVKEFVTWGLTAGQAHAQPLGYIALPESVVAWSRLAVGTIR